jgi:hypothetical protein
LGAAHLTEQTDGRRILRLDKGDDVFGLMLCCRFIGGVGTSPFRRRCIRVLGAPVRIPIVQRLAEQRLDDVSQFFARRLPIIC